MDVVRILGVFFSFVAILALSGPPSSAIDSSQLDQHVVALFHFDEPNGQSPADSSAGKSNITMGSSASLSNEGHVNGALRMAPRSKDSDSKTTLTVPDGKLDSSSFTIDFWIKVRSDNDLMRGDVYFLSSPNLFFRYNTDSTLQCFEFGIQTQKGWATVNTDKSKLSIQPNKWYHIAGSYDGSEVRLYVDEKLMGSADAAGPSPHGVYSIGSCGWSNDRQTELDGWIDDLRISTIPSIETAAVATEATPAVQNTQPSDVPLIVIPKTTTPPKVDGHPSGGAWDSAAWVGNPVYLNQKEITGKIDFQAALLWDDSALYVGFKVHQSRKPTTITATKGDDGLERDDSVEVTLNIPGFKEANGEPLQFKLNCVGLRDDAINFNFGWNTVWDGAVSQDGTDWYATFKLPFSSFKVYPKIGDKWSGNLGAFMVGYSYRAFLWTPVYTGHHHSGPFGTFEFGDVNTAPNSIRKIDKLMSTVRVSGTLASQGSVRVLILPDSDASKKEVKLGGFVNTNFDSETGKIIAQSVTRIDKPGEWTASVKDVLPGSYLAKVILMDATGKRLNVDIKPIKVDRSLVAKILRYPVHQSANAVISVYDMGKPGVLPASITVTVTDAKGAVVRTITQKAPHDLGESVTVSLGKLTNKESYKVLVKAVSADGHESVTDTVNFTLPVRPSWADTKAGALNGKVLKPWTPVKAKATAMSCWGRTYDLGNAIMPVSIVSSGNKILSDSIRFVAGFGPESIALSKAVQPAKVTVSKTGDVASFSAAAVSKVCSVKVDGSLEFDGFMTFNVSVKPRKSLDTFVLEIPLDNAIAKFVQPLPGAANQDGAGSIPDTGLNIDTLNTVYTANSLWICNGDAGFFFQCDSLQDWKSPKGEAVQIIRRGKDTLVRFNFYKSDAAFDHERNYKFYLQATPVRPFNKDWFGGKRYGAGLEWSYNTQALEPDTVLAIPMDGVSTAPAGTFEMTVQNLNDLKAITDIDYSDGYGPGFWEIIANIDSPSGMLKLDYAKPSEGIVLETPWGVLGLKRNAVWKPNELHKLAFTWGDKLRFYVDGKVQGELQVKGLPIGAAKLNLGSVSARYIMKGLRVRSSADDLGSLSTVEKMAKTADTLIYRSEDLKLRSNALTMLSLVKKRGYTITSLWEWWNQAQNGGISKYEPILKNITDDCHALGLQFTLYFGFEISTLPEFADIVDECKALVDQSPNFYAPHNQNTYFTSYGSPYREYLLENMVRLKKNLGIDGIYCDGTFSLGGADNPAYGCGYTDEKGNRVPTVPVERIREFAKRMNNIFMQDGGSVVAHLGVSPPTMGFATKVMQGEHLGWCGLNWSSVFQMVPQDVAQCVYNSKNTGVAKTLIVLNMWPTLRKGSPDKWYEHASTFVDLYRLTMPILGEWPLTFPSDNEAKKYQKFTEFGADRCEWIPYWNIDQKGLVSSPDMLMSAYRRSDGAMLCVVGNVTNKEVSGRIDFAAAPKLKLKPGQKCTELMTGKSFEIVDSKVEVSLPANEHYILKIE